jgi:outer membrane lipoprotein-sorting protein
MKALLLLGVLVCWNLAAADGPGVAVSPTAKEIVEKAQSVYAALSSYSSTGQTVSALAGTEQKTTFTIRLQRPGLYRIDWKSGFSSGSVWSDGTGDFLQMTGPAQKMQNREMALASATGVSGMAAATIPGTFFKENWGGALNPLLPLERKPDEKVGTVDCFVVSSEIKPPAGGTMTTTLWIGQQDSLIHQCGIVSQNLRPPQVTLTDEMVEQGLKMQGKPVTPEAIAAFRTQMAEAMKKAAGMTEAGPITFVQNQDNIAINKVYTAADFGHP